MEVVFEVYEESGIWIGRGPVEIRASKLEELVSRIKAWAEEMSKKIGKRIKVTLVNRAREPRYDLYVPGPVRPMEIRPDMFRV